MFHLQQTHFGKTKLLNFFYIINKRVGEIQSNYQQVDKGQYITYFRMIMRTLTNPKNQKILKDIGKSLKAVSLQKKDPYFQRSLQVLLNQVFPCFHCFSKTTPSLHHIMPYIFFPWKGDWNVTLLSYVPIVYFIIFVN